MSNEILRFAPSPTGGLHVGGVRTALLNWLYVRKYEGKLLLRIEDTDQERSTEESVRIILDGFAWLGMRFDGEPVFQSQNVETHRKYVRQLLERGHGYYCYCTPEVLEEKRRKALAEKGHVKYDGTCRNLTPEERTGYDQQGMPKVVRFRVPEGTTVWHDLVRGESQWENEIIGDFVILRVDGWPLYNLAVTVDDHLMGATLVMRAAEHLSNTPRQIMLYEALEWPVPKFAHLPMILGPDKTKLSKRHGATNIMEYRERGYLPQAVINFLALLGWSPGDGREKMPLDELIEAFSVEGISVKDAVFDERKLEWLNGQHLHDLSSEDLFDPVVERLVSEGLVRQEEIPEKRAWLLKFIDLLKERCRKIPDFVERGRCFFEDPIEYEAKGRKRHWKGEDLLARLRLAAERLKGLECFREEEIEAAIRDLAEELEISAAKLIHPIRLAVSGTSAGPGLFELLEMVGQETVVRRIRSALQIIEQERAVVS